MDVISKSITLVLGVSGMLAFLVPSNVQPTSDQSANSDVEIIDIDASAPPPENYPGPDSDAQYDSDDGDDGDDGGDFDYSNYGEPYNASSNDASDDTGQGGISQDLNATGVARANDSYANNSGFNATNYGDDDMGAVNMAAPPRNSDM